MPALPSLLDSRSLQDHPAQQQQFQMGCPLAVPEEELLLDFRSLQDRPAQRQQFQMGRPPVMPEEEL